MIRDFRPIDLDDVLDIWLDASVRAHDFVDPEFWRARLADMRERYIPASETFVYEGLNGVNGFYCLHGNSLAAIFVASGQQGAGIGSALLADAKRRRPCLELTVYQRNWPSVRFYERHGFSVVREQTDVHTGCTELLMLWTG